MASGRDLVREWLFEYACKHHMSSVLHEIASNHNTVWSEDIWSIPPIFPMMAVVHDIVENDLEDKYPTVIEIIDELYERASSLVPFRIYVKLNVALKVLVLFRMLRNSDRMILARLNFYFPRSGFHNPAADKETEANLNRSQREFRKFFLQLVVNEAKKKSYMEKKFEEEYGTDFAITLKELVKRFLSSINDSLPEPVIDKLLVSEPSSMLIQELSSSNSAAIEMLLDAIHGRDNLSEEQLVEILQVLQQDDASTVSVPRGPCFDMLTSSDLSPNDVSKCVGKRGTTHLETAKTNIQLDGESSAHSSLGDVLPPMKKAKFEDLKLHKGNNLAGVSNRSRALEVHSKLISCAPEEEMPSTVFNEKSSSIHPRSQLSDHGENCVQMSSRLNRTSIESNGDNQMPGLLINKRQTSNQLSCLPTQSSVVCGNRGVTINRNENYHTSKSTGAACEPVHVLKSSAGEINSTSKNSTDPLLRNCSVQLKSFDVEPRKSPQHTPKNPTILGHIYFTHCNEVGHDKPANFKGVGSVVNELEPTDDSKETNETTGSFYSCSPPSEYITQQNTGSSESPSDAIPDTPTHDRRSGLPCSSLINYAEQSCVTDSEDTQLCGLLPNDIVPSSYSFDKFQLVCSDTCPLVSLPQLDHHCVKNSKLCIVMLNENPDIEFFDRNGQQIEIYN